MTNLIAPSKDGLMVGFPPPAEKRITPNNSHLPNHLGWRILNSNRLFPMARISRGERPIVDLLKGENLDVGSLLVPDDNGHRIQMHEVWERTGVDATLVLHKGKVVHESYLGDMSSTRQHPMFSCTKSVVGLLIENLIYESKVDAQAPVSTYLSELGASPVGSATIRQLLNMQANFMFSDKPKADGQVQVDYIMGLGFLPRPPNYAGANGAYELLENARPMGEHGGPFRYDNGSTDALGWVLRRLTNRTLDQLISEKIWAHLGAEQDASMLVDVAGIEWAGAGMAACLRDFARLGEMFRNFGFVNGQQLFPKAVFEVLTQGGEPSVFAAGAGVPAGGSYKSQWWFNHDKHNSFGCRGQYGQRIWIAPQAETVIAQFAIDPTLTALEPLRQRGFQAIADALV